MKKYACGMGLVLALAFLLSGKTAAQLQGTDLLNEPTDISPDFTDFKNTYYLADELVAFDPATATGTIRYRRYEYATRMAFNNMLAVLNPVNANEFPATEYETSPELPF